MNTATIDTERIKSSVDLRELASTYTTLHRESAKELAGPCPKPGCLARTDGFHVQEQKFMCRKCHPKWGDAIEFMTWMHNVTFKEAAAMLTGGAFPMPATPRKPEAKQAKAREWDAVKAAKELERYQSALWDDANTLAHDYLETKRGLDPHTWLLFGLGYRHDASLPNTWDASTRSYCYPPQPALVIPWYHKSKLVALRYRFLQPHTYTGIGEDEPRTEKQTSRGNFSGHIFGGHVMRRYGASATPAARTLLLCEGELNAMSIWQAARGTGLDVLSLGSESQHLPDDAIAYARRYRRVMVWSDRKEIAARLQAVLPDAFAVTSEMCQGQDANDLLRAHHLGGYLSTWRFQMCQAESERDALCYNLLDAANTLFGIDAGSRSVLQAIGATLPRLSVEIGQAAA